MTASMNVYGFRYQHDGRNYALDVLAASEADAKAKVASMAAAEFLSELRPEPEPTTNRTGLQTT